MSGGLADMDTEMDRRERITHYRSDVPSELAETYYQLTGMGCLPRCAAAAVRYIAQFLDCGENVTQAELASEYGTTRPTIRKWKRTAWKEHTGCEWGSDSDE